MELIGRVLWWSERDENGIIIDPLGNEFYFDRSVLKLRPRQSIKRDSLVTFHLNESIKDCLCARNVQIPIKNKKRLVENQYRQDSLFHLQDNAA